MARYRLVNGVIEEITGADLDRLTQEEQQNEAAQTQERARRQLRRNKINAYRDKGWINNGEFDALSFFEDMADRTALVVLAELKQINDGLVQNATKIS